MVKVIFTFEVPPEKQDEYLKATSEKIKPYWESHGCQSYRVWREIDEVTFIKEMVFADMEMKEKTMGIKDEASDAIRGLWKSFVGDVSIKTFIEQI